MKLRIREDPARSGPYHLLLLPIALRNDPGYEFGTEDEARQRDFRRLCELVRGSDEHAKVSVMNVGYGEGAITPVQPNQAQFSWSVDERGVLREVEQRMTVGDAPEKREVKAHWNAERNVTVIEVLDKATGNDGNRTRPGAADSKITRAGLVLLRLTVVEGQVAIEY